MRACLRTCAPAAICVYVRARTHHIRASMQTCLYADMYTRIPAYRCIPAFMPACMHEHMHPRMREERHAQMCIKMQHTQMHRSAPDDAHVRTLARCRRRRVASETGLSAGPRVRQPVGDALPPRPNARALADDGPGAPVAPGARHTRPQERGATRRGAPSRVASASRYAAFGDVEPWYAYGIIRDHSRSGGDYHVMPCRVASRHVSSHNIT